MSAGCSTCRSASGMQRASLRFSPSSRRKAITRRPTTRRSCVLRRCLRDRAQPTCWSGSSDATLQPVSAPAATCCCAVWRHRPICRRCRPIGAALIDVLPGRFSEVRGARSPWATTRADEDALSSSISLPRQAGSMPALRRVRSSTCWPGPRHTGRTMSWSRPRWPSPSRRRARHGRRSSGCARRLSITLRRRIALPLEAPRDWARPDPLKCTCADCRQLGAFLVAADRPEWRLKAPQDRRSHVEQSVRNATCDIDLTTERRGSPHALVAVKNQASYEQRAKQRRRDLEHVSALGG